MKRTFTKKLISAALSLNMASALTITQLPAAAFGIEKSVSTSTSGFKAAPLNFSPILKTDDSESTELKNLPLFEGLSTDEALRMADSDKAPLPASFTLKDFNKVTPVTDQELFGTCWAFGAVASAESDLVDLYPDIDLSELHTAYFPYSGSGLLEYSDFYELTNEQDLLNFGGSNQLAINIWSQWIGPVYEEKLPYYEAQSGNITGAYDIPKNYQDFLMKNAHIINYADRTDYENRDAVNQIIKDIIHNGNVVNASYAHIDRSSYAVYNGTDSGIMPNHSVAIIGWDDNYSTNAFSNTNVPSRNGAWLVKNSWGEDDTSSLNGYTWISYDELSLGDFTYFDMASKGEYDNIQYYDSLGYNASFTADEKSGVSYEATVFASEGNELLQAISTYSVAPDTDYEITVYTNITDYKNPSSGTPHIAGSGTFKESGYFTVEFDTPVLLDENQAYSVVVKLENKDYPYVIPTEAYVSGKIGNEELELGLNNFTLGTLTENTEKFTSYFSSNGKNWTDTALYNYDVADSEKQEMLNVLYEYFTDDEIRYTFGTKLENIDFSLTLGNINLKAITTDYDRVNFNFNDVIPANQNLVLSSDNCADMFYSINDGEYIRYEEPIEINEETKISAYTVESDNICTRVIKPAQTDFIDFSYTVDTGLKLERFDAEFDKTDKIHSIFVELSPSVMDSFVPNFNSPSSRIIINGEEYIKGTPLDLHYGENVFKVTLCETETHTERVCKLGVYVNPIEWSFSDEMLIADENVVVTLENGTVFEPFVPDSIGDLADSNIHVTVYDDNGNITYECDDNIPPRAYINNEVYIDYESEAIGGFTSEELLNMNVIINDTEYKKISDSDFLIMGDMLYIEPGTKYEFYYSLKEGVYFESDRVIVETPERPEAPKEIMFEYSVEDNAITFLNKEPAIEFASREHYTPIRTYEDLYKLYEECVSQESLDDAHCTSIDDYINYSMWVLDYTIDELISGQDNFNKTFSPLETAGVDGKQRAALFADETTDKVNMDLGVRYAATESQFASEYTFKQLTAERNNQTEPKFRGDINNDNTIDALDASLILSMYAEISTGKNIDVNSYEFYAADVDQNGSVNSSDASIVLSYYAYISVGGQLDFIDYITG